MLLNENGRTQEEIMADIYHYLKELKDLKKGTINRKD